MGEAVEIEGEVFESDHAIRIAGLILVTMIAFFGLWMIQFIYGHFELLEQVMLPVDEADMRFEDIVAQKEGMINRQFVFLLGVVIVAPVLTILSLGIAFGAMGARNMKLAMALLVLIVVGWGASVWSFAKLSADAKESFRESIDYVAGQGQPLVDAVLEYRAEHGAHPKTLDVLVPGYLETIPVPGIAGADRFEYSVRDDDFRLSATLAYDVPPVRMIVYDSAGVLFRTTDPHPPGWGYWVLK